MGRIDPNEPQRFELRLTAYEKNRLRINAARAGLSIASYVRKTAVYGKEPSPVNIDLNELVRLNFELRKEGANLNQIARTLNTYGMAATDLSLLSAVMEKISLIADEAARIVVAVREQYRQNTPQ